MGARFLGLRGSALSLAQILLVVAPAFILFGYNQSGIGGLLSEKDWVATFPEIDTVNTHGAQQSHNSTIQGLTVATYTLGALIGALSGSYIGDLLGRRKVIAIGGLLTLIGEVLECSSFSLAQFIVGRIIIGMGVGMMSATVPVWQSECSSSKNRGKHVVLDGAFISLGYTFESWIDLGFYEFKTGSVTWRPPIAIAIFFSLMVMATVFFMPESPRWLIRQNRVEEARQTLSALKNQPEDSPEIEAEIIGIELVLEDTAANGASL